MELKSIHDCDQELDRLSREQSDAIRDNANKKLKYLESKRAEVVNRKIELQHGDLFLWFPASLNPQERAW